MTLINDNLENVKTSLLVAIKKELTEAYPKEFGDYKTSKGDTCTKVYWADTVRFQPKYPYCILTPQKDTSEGYNETTYYKNSDGILIKRVIVRSFMTVTIEIYDMGNELNGRTSLEADTFAHKVVRQLRSYFNGDDKLDWFSGNEYYDRQIGITVQNDIVSILDWADTDTQFRYNFDIRLGWDDITDSIADTAEGIEATLYDGDTSKELYRTIINKQIKGESKKWLNKMI